MVIEVEVLNQEAKTAIRESPKFFNQEFNRSFPATLGEFMRGFTKTSLQGKGGIRVRRRVNKVPSRGGPTIPAKARAMGFSGRMRNRKTIDGKAAIVRTSSPVAVIHEEGGTIRPRRGRFLFIQVDNASAARRGGVRIGRGKRPKVIKVRKVTIRARLRFFSQWTSFLPRARNRLFASFKKGRDRAILAAKKKAARAFVRRRRRAA